MPFSIAYFNLVYFLNLIILTFLINIKSVVNVFCLILFLFNLSNNLKPLFADTYVFYFNLRV